MSAAELHSAGATVRHASPFASLPVPKSKLQVSGLPEWARRLFSIGLFQVDDLMPLVGEHMPEVDPDLVVALLSVFDWRPRIIGTYLASVRGFRALEPTIGDLLLRSDVCYAGAAYCQSLAHFNSARALQYLTTYLDYYLTRRELWFDQGSALAAVVCLDERNGTSIASRYDQLWREYSLDKPHHDVSGAVDHFKHQLDALELAASRFAAPSPDAG